ncbi:MAG: hypothetical protein EA397_14465 [Deltaproteobacteria bacterium]|nr:MAG: hypothetical protein EA397_14465 [Deltaproteobacteria bacterium]
MRTLPSLVILLACGGGTSSAPCPPTDAPPPSVLVNLTSDLGEPIPQPRVTYVYDGFDPGECTPLDEPAVTFGCGEDRPGPFEVTATGYGYPPQSASAVVIRAGCELLTEELDLELTHVECPDRSSTSLRVTVLRQNGDPVPGVTMHFLPQSEGWDAPEPCEQREPRTFLCGEDHVGPIDLLTQAEGFVTDERTVTVHEDPCGMVPQEVAVVMRSR